MKISNWIIVALQLAFDLKGVESVDENYVLRWASSGGGWRAMMSNVGYANLFYQAGLITDDSCNFTAVSTNSGGSWFSSQFFFSEAFLNKALQKDPEDVYQFVMEWMDAYREFSDSYEKEGNGRDMEMACRLLSPIGLSTMADDLSSTCKLLQNVDTSWADYLYGMLKTVSMKAYKDDGMADRIFSPETRLTRFQSTNIMMQTGIASTAMQRVDPPRWRQFLQRFRVFQRYSDDVISYIGPNSAEKEVFAVPVAVQFNAFSGAAQATISYGVEDSLLPLQLYTSQAPKDFESNMWQNYYPYNGIAKDGSIFTSLPENAASDALPLNAPFSGEAPTVSQVAAASSATFSHLSGASPSFLEQYYSVKKYEVQVGTDAAKRAQLQAMKRAYEVPYNTRVTDDLSMCSNWPNACETGDFRFIDGGFTDGPTLSMNIGHHHKIENGDLSKTMKVILTNNNYVDDGNTKFLSYFRTDFNEGVAPGDYIWAPYTVPGTLAQSSPWRSMQIFDEYLDDASMLAAFEPILTDAPHENWNLTTARYSGTTIENTAFGVKAGQTVEILLLQINSRVPVNIAANSAQDRWNVPMAEMVRDIAGSKELLSRIQDFLSS